MSVCEAKTRGRQYAWRAVAVIFVALAWSAAAAASSRENAGPNHDAAIGASPDSSTLGIRFIPGSATTLLMERNGKTYLVDVVAHSIREVSPASTTHAPALRNVAYSSSHPTPEAGAQDPPAPADNKREKKHRRAYRPGDDALFNLPTGRRLDRHGLVIDFSHRFPYEAAFTGQARGATLLGLDDFSISSFGFRYGVTRNLEASVYRSPSIVGRVIELGATYHLLNEQDGKPFNAALRFSVDGQNNFQRNFTSNLELLLSRSITRRAQIYFVPTGSLHNRPLLSESSIVQAPPYLSCGQALVPGSTAAFSLRPCADTFSLGAGISVDIRPTVALVADVIPTVVHAEDLGIHRPPFAFGIQKKIWRHAFTFGFSTGPGSTTSQRIGTRAAFLHQPGADVPSGMFVGFNLNRQLR